jgi:hypothetical protein
MASTPDASNRFILEVFDCTLWCPIAQAPFYPGDVGPLRSILELGAADDAELKCHYYLDDDQIAAIVSAFGTFDPRQLDDEAAEIGYGSIGCPAPSRRPTSCTRAGSFRYCWRAARSWRSSRIGIHHHYSTARKPSTGGLRMVSCKEVIDVPFEKPTKRSSGDRTVYYTPKGEEWRIPAHKLVQDASGKSGGWNEHFQRLEGMLFGYEDWQNDWWINTLLERGTFGGATFCCAVTAAGLAWAESAGLRALPPTEALSVISYWRKTTDVPSCSTLSRPSPSGGPEPGQPGQHQMDRRIGDDASLRPDSHRGLRERKESDGATGLPGACEHW